MNGATAEPSVNIINAPNNTRNMTMGVNHHFFLTFRNSQNSATIDSLLILFPPLHIVTAEMLTFFNDFVI